MPDLGEGLQEAEIVAWHVADGEHVVADQPLVSVETEKAVVEIPSPHSGRIRKLLVKPGERIPVGTPLLDFEEGAVPDTGTVVGHLEEIEPSSAAQISRAAPAVRARARELGIDLAHISPTGIGRLDHHGRCARSSQCTHCSEAERERSPARRATHHGSQHNPSLA